MSFQKQPSGEQLFPQIKAWFSSDLGQELLARERQLVEKMTSSLFGAHLVQVSVDSSIKLYEECPVAHCFSIVPKLELGIDEYNIVASGTEIPLAHESVDAVLLHHAMDFTENPHQVLREASRILRPGGHLIVIGFNPFSLWGLYRCFSRKKDQAPWCGHFISHRRLQDWLKLLELTELKSISGYHRAPIANNKWRWRLCCNNRFLRGPKSHYGAFSVVMARKDIAGMTPLRSGWGLRRLINLPVAEPTAREHIRESR